MDIVNHDIHSILRDNWGYDSFRPAQQEIIRSILSGRDTIGLLPTGGGKSITFQVPALAIDGLTLVVSPLISLMKDQVDNLRSRGITAVYLHSALSRREVTLAIDRCRLGKAKLLYLSPEKLMSRSFIYVLRQLPIQLIVVDEAHCISQWGYDFRPSYLAIASLRDRFPSAPVLALTASATPEVVDDIADKLRMSDPAIHRLSFSRNNLSYIVRITDFKEGKLIEVLQKIAGCAIVYVRSRRRTREIAQALLREGISADYYHAGLDPHEKEERQNRWKADQTRVMVATNAFGMGIDKPDVRIVIHTDLPSSLEEYYQEAGRAGRDGKPSLAVIIASHRDKAVLSRRLSESFPEKNIIRNIYTRTCAFLDIAVGTGYNSIHEFNFSLFCQRHSLQPAMVNSALKLLTQAGWIDYSEEVSTQSRVMMLSTKEELYSLRLPTEADIVLRQLLRSYTGLFADYVYISEPSLASACSLSEQQVYESLLLLTRMHTLHYVPRRTSPYIFFPTSREDEAQITIPRSIYEERRQRMATRIDAIKQMVFDNTRCRVATMLHYFGETSAGDCGQCDVCRARRKASASPTASLSDRILYLLRDGRTLTPLQLASAINASTDKISQATRELLDRGLIVSDSDNRLSQPHTDTKQGVIE